MNTLTSYTQYAALSGLWLTANLLRYGRVITRALCGVILTATSAGIGCLDISRGDWHLGVGQFLIASLAALDWWRHRGDDDDNDRGKRLRHWLRDRIRSLTTRAAGEEAAGA